MQSKLLSERNSDVCILISHRCEDRNELTCSTFLCLLDDTHLWNSIQYLLPSLRFIACQLGIGEVSARQSNVFLHPLVVNLR